MSDFSPNAVLQTTRTISQPLFDKFINMKLFRKAGGIDVISTPSSGIKPEIALSGRFIDSDVMGDIVLRITNFYPSIPLNEYEFVEIEAGYKGLGSVQDSTSVSMRASIQTAYQETPSPDGVTVFELLTGDFYIEFLNAIINNNWRFGTLLSTVLNDICSILSVKAGRKISLDLGLSTLNTEMLKTNIYFNGYVKDLIIDLSQKYSFNYYLDGSRLVAFPMNGSTGKTYSMNFFTSSPIRSAAGITFSAPWIPSMRCGDSIVIDPKFFKMNYGASQIDIKPILNVQTINFQFNTISDSNQMTVLALNTADLGASV